MQIVTVKNNNLIVANTDTGKIRLTIEDVSLKNSSMGDLSKVLSQTDLTKTEVGMLIDALTEAYNK